MLAELDETVRQLLIRYVPVDPVHIDVSFDLPDREWSSRLTRPTINCFLYDVRENLRLRSASWETRRTADSASRQKGPLRIDATYQVSTWARANEDQHQLLWRTLAALARHPILSSDALVGDLKLQPLPVCTAVAQPDQVRANIEDFWNAIDNKFRPTVTYVVTLALDPEIVINSKLTLSSPTIKVEQLATDEIKNGFTIRGKVRDQSDPERAIKGALVVLSETGDRMLTEEDGKFSFGGVRRGPITLIVRAAGRLETTWPTRVPASNYDLEV
jgi:hypothetical protein